MTGSRRILLAGVSSIALAASAPAVLAADLPPKPPIYTKAPPVRPAPSPWTWWVEGGAQGVLGDPFIPAFNSPFDAAPRNWGGTGAAGFIYRFDSIWLVAVDFRFGENYRKLRSFQGACATSNPTCFTPLQGPNSATHKEYNWVTDIMFGRDVGLGLGNSQVEAGLRIAQIRGTTHGVFTGSPTFGTGVVQTLYTQTNKFFGIGPRVALVGTFPIAGAWFLDYQFGAAGLFADRSTTQTASVISNSIFLGCFGACPINASTSSNGFVFNPDAMLGIGYLITPSAKLTLNYRVDAYFDAFRVFNPAGVPTYTNRIDHGPNLRLTWVFP